jgi:hypothetical protein
MLTVGIAGSSGSEKTTYTDLIIQWSGEDQVGTEMLISIFKSEC